MYTDNDQTRFPFPILRFVFIAINALELIPLQYFDYISRLH